MQVTLLAGKREMKLRKGFTIISTLLLLFILPSVMVPAVYGAPSGTIDDPVSPDNPENILTFTQDGLPGGTEQVTITFWNIKDATPDQLTDVASTIQYITLAAVNLNPTRVGIVAGTDSASWKIFEPGAVNPRVEGFVTPLVSPGTTVCVPPSACVTADLYTWPLEKPDGASNLEAYTDSGTQFAADLRILRPGERVELTITVQCQGIEGDSRIWFFFRATEWAPSDETDPSTYPTTIGTIPEAQRWNLYYSKIPRQSGTYWLPLHNSYDPTPDPDIPNTGHNFDQHSWERGATTTAFAKSNKLVHQTRAPPPDGGQQLSTVHICGTKFNDINGDGAYDPEFDPGINGVTVMLLGADAQTLASQYYPGQFSYPIQEGDVMVSGENNLPGSYCFNLENTLPGTYTFYIKIEEPLGMFPTTPTMIGPITIVVPLTSTVILSANHNFGNGRPPVGGMVLPVDSLVSLAPWIGFLGVLAVVIGLVAVSKKRNN